MHIAGSRRILAPAHRVQTTLTDPDLLAARLTPSHARLAQAGAETLAVWELDGGEAKFQITDGPEDSTQVAYDAEADGDDEAQLKRSIETLLDALQSEAAGPREIGADGAIAVAGSATHAGFPFRAMPNLIFGMPLIFWAGSAIFFFIFVFMFGAYL